MGCKSRCGQLAFEDRADPTLRAKHQGKYKTPKEIAEFKCHANIVEVLSQQGSTTEKNLQTCTSTISGRRCSLLPEARAEKLLGTALVDGSISLPAKRVKNLCPACHACVKTKYCGDCGCLVSVGNACDSFKVRSRSPSRCPRSSGLQDCTAEKVTDEISRSTL